MSAEQERDQEAADRFVTDAIIGYGTEKAHIAAVQAVLNAAGFKATATCAPVFGGIWPHPCAGRDAPAASAWLQQLTDSMPRGKFEWERDHVLAAITARRMPA